jgi:methionine-rich copper-binding protein CopC
MSIRRRTAALAALTVSLAVATAAVSAPAASAHATLLRSTPAANSTVTTSPPEVELVFDEAIADQGAAILVTDAAGRHYQQAGTLTYAGTRLTVALDRLGAAGTYTVAARWVADDGDPQTDSFTFTYAPAGQTASTTAAATPSTATSGSGSGGSAGSPARWLLLVVVALLAGGGLWWARPRKSPPGTSD